LQQAAASDKESLDASGIILPAGAERKLLEVIARLMSSDAATPRSHETHYDLGK
jgi:hypothetical protein